MTRYSKLCEELQSAPRRWVVTGAAGFIGSALVERLLELGQSVTGVDNFLTGHRRNVDDVVSGAANAERYQFLEGDIRDEAFCQRAMEGAELVLHQAALGSVPRSIENPLATHHNNVTGFLNVLVAARDAKVNRLVYASSSSVYGDHPALPKQEDVIGEPLSPYAVSKRVDEMYADVFQRVYGTELIGLRYFNVFGRRQDPHGPYAAVIPKWIELLAAGKQCVIYGDGTNSRDFCYIDNVVQANLLAATADASATGRKYNVGVGGNTNLLQLFDVLRDNVARHVPGVADAKPEFAETRPGDVPHSQASIERLQAAVGYSPTHDLEKGLTATVDWFLQQATTKLEVKHG